MLDTIDICIRSVEEAGYGPDRDRYTGLRPPLIMGILNVTPDSFYDGGSYPDLDSAVRRAVRMVEEGADLIDVGGESTRPFAEPVSISEEKDRVLPVIGEIRKRVDVPISIDTRHPDVAKDCVKEGASIINDVSALSDPTMVDLVQKTETSAVIMHMKGDPRNMQESPYYDDPVEEVFGFLNDRVRDLNSRGIPRERLFVDPGIGFGKRTYDNLMIIENIGRFRETGCHVLVGASRKSFIGNVLFLEPGERYEGSIASALMAVERGASIVRVHDVAGTKRALSLWNAFSRPERYL